MQETLVSWPSTRALGSLPPFAVVLTRATSSRARAICSTLHPHVAHVWVAHVLAGQIFVARTPWGRVGHARSGSYYSRRRLTTTTPISFSRRCVLGRPMPALSPPSSLPCPSLVSHLTSAPQCLSNPAGKLTRKSHNNNTPFSGKEEHVMIMTMARWRSRMADHLCPLEQARTSPRASDSSCPWRARCSRRPTS